MKSKARRNSLRIAVLCAVAALLPTASFALPRQGSTHKCGCMCFVTLGDGTRTSVYETFNLPPQYLCGSAEGKVCNVSDPTSGGVRQGTMEGCGDDNLHVTPLPFKPPVTNPIGSAPTR
jgi:hypothetical protein